MILKKIRSGGQTGADQGGLFAGKALHLETGGWLPKGCLTEAGPRPDLITDYGLVEHLSDKYRDRTIANVRDSDGTVWFGKTGSLGYRCTLGAAQKLSKVFITIHSSEQLRQFVQTHNIRELNVAGNRESRNPGIFAFTYNTIVEAFKDEV